MITQKVIILIVSSLNMYGGTGIDTHTSDPHRYYPTIAACEIAGRQWLHTKQDVIMATDENPKRRVPSYATFSCKEQTILVPGGVDNGR